MERACILIWVMGYWLSSHRAAKKQPKSSLSLHLRNHINILPALPGCVINAALSAHMCTEVTAWHDLTHFPCTVLSNTPECFCYGHLIQSQLLAVVQQTGSYVVALHTWSRVLREQDHGLTGTHAHVGACTSTSYLNAKFLTTSRPMHCGFVSLSNYTKQMTRLPTRRLCN